MRETVLRRRVGTATTAKAKGRETIRKRTSSGMVKPRDGNKPLYGGTVDGGKRNHGLEPSENRGRKENITQFLVPVP